MWRSVVLTWLAAAALLAAALYFFTERRSHFLVCITCAKLRITSRWVLPLIGVGLPESHREEDTRLSRLLFELQVVKEHEHDWVFGHGLNYRAGVGSGLFLEPNTRSVEVEHFLRWVAESMGTSEVERWRAILLDPQHPVNFGGVLVSEDFPAEGFSDKRSFEEWWHNHHDSLEKLVKELRER
ncbi:MAG: hypothetical protein FJ291_02745 [Planctomycetes bacterium]|nr:hypothetical protein [Planctomycetota bacterium]